MPTYDESVDFDANAEITESAQQNVLTWSVGEIIYLDNQHTFGSGRKFDFNYLPDDIAILEAMSGLA